MDQLFQQASNWLDDAETLFLGILKQNRMPPRGAAEESRVLDHAEFFRHRIAMPQLKAIQEMVAKFGPTVQSMVDSLARQKPTGDKIAPSQARQLKQNSRQWFKRFCGTAFQFRYYCVGDRVPQLHES